MDAAASDWVHIQKYIHAFVTMQSSTEFFNSIRSKVLQIPSMKVDKKEVL